MAAITILSDDVIKDLLSNLQPQDLAPILSSLKEAFKNYSVASDNGETESLYQPERAVITRPTGQKTLFMPATSSNYVGAKIVGVPPPRATGKTLTGVLVLCDAEGKPVGILNSQELTAFRTALGSMPLLQYRCTVENVVVFGAGKQAYWHVRLALLLRPGKIKHITVVNRSRGRSDDLIQKLQPHVSSEVSLVVFDPAADARESELKSLVQSADVIFCTTPAKTPLFPHHYLEHTIGQGKGPYIAAIGSYHESMSELDPTLFAKIAAPEEDGRLRIDSQIVVDSKSGCLQEAGEIIQAKLSEDNLFGVGEVLHYLEQHSTEEMTQHDDAVHKWMKDRLLIYKSVGMGVMDLAVGGAILELARDKYVGDTSSL